MSNVWGDEKLKEVLISGGVAVMPTDTIYGIVGQAIRPDTVEKIYMLRKRAPEKPCIILVGDISEIKKFGIDLSEIQMNIMAQAELPTSFILDSTNEDFSYLDRGTKALAFRIPKIEELRSLLLDTGPLIAPSANTEGMMPAKNITEARAYFGGGVDCYMDGGDIVASPSRVVKLHSDGTTTIIR
jgi:L-threonylcarbamoyladenylate synthase